MTLAQQSHLNGNNIIGAARYIIADIPICWFDVLQALCAQKYVASFIHSYKERNISLQNVMTSA